MFLQLFYCGFFFICFVVVVVVLLVFVVVVVVVVVAVLLSVFVFCLFLLFVFFSFLFSFFLIFCFVLFCLCFVLFCFFSANNFEKTKHVQFWFGPQFRLKDRVTGPRLVHVCPCFRENVIFTCKIVSFLRSLDSFLLKI